MFKNYVFDLYGTLIDINTNEWQKKLWEKLSILYKYKGASYTAKEIAADYGKYVDAEKKRVHRRHPEYTEIDISAILHRKGRQAHQARASGNLHRVQMFLDDIHQAL